MLLAPSSKSKSGRLDRPVDIWPYPIEAKPVFFGHYKMHGAPMINAPNAACLDCPKVASAYKWAGEARLDPLNPNQYAIPFDACEK